MLKSALSILGVLSVVSLLAFGLLTGHPAYKPGALAPSASVPVLGQSKSATLAASRGHWVLVNVWASYCPPCRQEAGVLEAFSRRHRGEIRIIGVDTEDTTEDALAYVHTFGINYPQWHDGDGSFSHALGATGYPESFILDPNGRFRGHYPGPFADQSSVDAFAASALRPARHTHHPELQNRRP